MKRKLLESFELHRIVDGIKGDLPKIKGIYRAAMGKALAVGKQSRDEKHIDQTDGQMKTALEKSRVRSQPALDPDSDSTSATTVRPTEKNVALRDRGGSKPSGTTASPYKPSRLTDPKSVKSLVSPVGQKTSTDDDDDYLRHAARHNATVNSRTTYTYPTFSQAVGQLSLEWKNVWIPTGGNDGGLRSELQSLLNQCKVERINTVHVKKLSNFLRDTEQHGSLKQSLRSIDKVLPDILLYLGTEILRNIGRDPNVDPNFIKAANGLVDIGKDWKSERDAVKKAYEEKTGVRDDDQDDSIGRQQVNVADHSIDDWIRTIAKERGEEMARKVKNDWNAFVIKWKKEHSGEYPALKKYFLPYAEKILRGEVNESWESELADVMDLVNRVKRL